MNNIFKIASIVTFCFLFFNTTAQVVEKKTIIKNFNSENGLKQNSVLSIILDTNGITWIATEMGLYSYDGNSISEMNDKHFLNLSKQRITRMRLNQKTGDIYFSTYPENIIYKIHNQKIQKIGQDVNFSNGVFTNDNRFYKLNDKVLKSFLKTYNNNKVYLTKGIPQYQLSLDLKTTTDYLYIKDKNRIFVFDNNAEMQIINYSFSEKSKIFKFGETILVLDNGKEILINGTKIVENKIVVDPILKNKEIPNLQGSFLGSGETYYCKWNNNIYQIEYINGKLKTNFLFKSISNDLNSIYYNSKDQIYNFGTGTDGMFILSNSSFKHLIFNNLYTSCYGVVKIKNKWYSDNGGVFDLKSKQVNNPKNIFSSYSPRFLLNYNNNFYHSNNGCFYNIKTKEKLQLFFKEQTKYKSLTGYTYFKKQLWLCDNQNLYYNVNNFLITDSFISHKFKNEDISSITTFNNKIIITTSKGVFLYKPFANQIHKIKGLETVYARYIKIIDANSFWVGCYGNGLFLVKNNKVYKVKDRNINLTTVHAIEEDKKGDLWFTSNDGLLRINKNEIINNTLQNKTIECYRYSTKDGLPTNEFNGGCTHPSLRDSTGMMGFPTIKGFVWFHPEEVPKHIFSGKININQITYDNKEIEEKDNQFKIPAEANLISIDFNYPYYFDRKNLSVEYRFADSKDWIKIEGDNLKLARTKSGKQQLLMRIRTHGFIQKKYYTQSFLFNFEARYYETIWFQLLIGTLFLVLLLFSYKIGVFINKKREKLLEKKIEEKTTELKKTVSELKSSKAFVTKSLKEKDILLKEVHHRVKNNLQLINSMLNIQARRNNYENIFDFLKKSETRIASMALIHQGLYQSESSLDKINFQLYTEDLVKSISQTFEGKSSNIKIEVKAKNITLNLDIAIPLGIIINELVTNSLKYAFPDNRIGKITIAIIEKKPNDYLLTVEDNGIGFDKDKLEKKSFGLELINLLVIQLNGNLIFDHTDTTKFIIDFEEINNME